MPLPLVHSCVSGTAACDDTGSLFASWSFWLDAIVVVVVIAAVVLAIVLRTPSRSRGALDVAAEPGDEVDPPGVRRPVTDAERGRTPSG